MQIPPGSAMVSNRADIDAVAHKIAVALLDDVAEMYANSKVDTPLPPSRAGRSSA